MVRGPGAASGQTRKRLLHRILRLTVEFYPALLGWRRETATEGRGSCDVPWKRGDGLGWTHATSLSGR